MVWFNGKRDSLAPEMGCSTFEEGLQCFLEVGGTGTVAKAVTLEIELSR